MKLEIEKQLLLSLIKEIKEIINSINYIFALRGVLFKVKKNNIEIHGASENSFIIKTLKNTDQINIIEEGEFLINSNLFFEIISKLKNGKITMFVPEENLMLINDSSAKFEINLIDKNKSPILKINDKIESSFKINGSDFKNYLKMSLASVDETSENQIFKAVNLKSIDNKLFLTSTDSFRISRINTEIKTLGEIDHLITNKSIRELLKVIGNQEIKIYFNNKNIIIQDKDFIIQIKIIVKKFHDLSKILSFENKYNLLIKKQELVSLIETVKVIKSVDRSSIKFTIKNQILTLQTNELELGSAKIESKNFKFDNDDEVIFILNSNYLLEILRVLTSEEIILRIENENKPIIIAGVNDSKQIHLLLPLKEII